MAAGASCRELAPIERVMNRVANSICIPRILEKLCMASCVRRRGMAGARGVCEGACCVDVRGPGPAVGERHTGQAASVTCVGKAPGKAPWMRP